MEWILLVLGVIGLSGFRIMREYERAVVFRLGRARKELAGPGVVWLLPLGMDRAKLVDVRIKAIPIDPQEIITSDNISIKVNAVVYFRVIDPNRAIVEVEDYLYATSQLSQTTLRSVLGQVELDDLLAERDKINHRIQAILDTSTEPWGIKAC